MILRCILHLASASACCSNRSDILRNLLWALRNANWKGQILRKHPSHPTHTVSDSHTHTPCHSLSPQQLWGKGSLTLCSVCCVEPGTEQQAELRLCDQIWNGRESHSSSCSFALRASHSDRGQSQGHRGPLLLPLPSAYNADYNWVICSVKSVALDWVLFVYVFPIVLGARMRMRELSLRQDPDLRKELAQLARGCDFVLPSRFKKRLRAFQQGQAGVCMNVHCSTQAAWSGETEGRHLLAYIHLQLQYTDVIVLCVCCMCSSLVSIHYELKL